MKNAAHSNDLQRAISRPMIQYLFLFLGVFLVYLPTFWYTFVWDDFGMIGYNKAIRDWTNIPRFFTDPTTFAHTSDDVDNVFAWRPLRNVYFLITYKLHDLRPAGWHMQQVFLHATCSMLLLGFFRRVFSYAARSNQQAELTPAILAGTWIAAFAWAVHPANTEVLGWMKAADDIIACIFGLAALIVLLPPDGRPAIKAIIAAAILYALGLLAKESLPPIAVIYPTIILFLAPTFKSAMTNYRAITATTILALLTVTYIVIRHQLLGQTSQVSYIAGNFSLMMATMTTAITRYLQLTFWPFWPTVQLGSYYHWPVAESWLQPNVILSTTLILAMLTVSLALGYRNRVFLVGVLFTLAAFLPAANIVPMMQILAERFMYFPLMGVALCLACITAWWLRPAPVRRAWLPAVLCTGLIITTEMRLPVWIDEFAFQKEIIRVIPDETRALYNLGAIHNRYGQKDEALKWFTQATKITPDRFPPAVRGNYWYSINQAAMAAAKIHADNADFDKAFAMMEEARALNGASAEEYALTGDIHRFAKQTTQALTHYYQAIDLGLKTPILYIQMARTYELQEDYIKSLEYVNKALELEPELQTGLKMKDDLTTRAAAQIN